MQKNLKDIFQDIPETDNRSVQFLINALEKNNIDGFDYIEYKQALSALAALDIDEATAFKSAFATATTMGLTREKLIKTAQFYLDILQKEKSQFEQAVRQQVQRQVAGKEQQAKNYKKSIKTKKQQIEKMKEQILEHQAKINDLMEEIEGSKSKIVATKQNFDKTFELVEGAVKADIDKIQVYIK